MGCCGQTSTGAGITALDDGKRVNYTLGMLLGVDDFVQESAYQNARRHELARELLGYGTARGLQVVREDSGSGPRVRVTPGMAWMPSGRAVCVGSEQCCDLNGWLRQHAAEVQARVSGAGATPVLPLFVVLSHAECLTDPVPIPGEPCRSEDDLTRNSRIADGFRLELRLAPPPQREEDAIRDFADWLAGVPVSAASPPLGEADFMAQLRAAAQAWLVASSPPLSPSDFMFGSPPASLVAGGDLLHAAFTLWVTELRPVWRARYGCGPLPLPAGGTDDAVLLAELSLPLEGTPAGWQADDARASALDESRRPVLLSLRMVQELITRNPAPEPGNSVAPETAFGLAPDAGGALAFARADHSHGTPPLSGDSTIVAEGGAQRVQVEGLRRVPIAATPANVGDALVLRQVAGARTWTPEPFPVPVAPGTAVTQQTTFGLPGAVGTGSAYARADHSHGTPSLSGDAGSVTEGGAERVRVEGLRRVPIAATVPNAGDVLVLQDNAGTPTWTPQPLATPPLPGSAVVAATSFGLSGSAGSSAAYARADHSHGTPSLSGDATVVVEGTAQRVRVEGLRRVPIAAGPGNPGDVLVLRDAAGQREWRFEPLPTGGAPVPAGEFVGRRKEPFALIGAGHFSVDIAATGAPAVDVRDGSRYGGLAPLGARVQGNAVTVAFRLPLEQAGDDRFRHVVKLTPVWLENSKQEFTPYLVDTVSSEGTALLVFAVRLRTDGEVRPGRFEFQVEVSRFGL